jgi:uncharacterized protein (TIGR03083 family)
MADTNLITVLRRSHDRLTTLLRGLDADGLRTESYDPGWSIAQVASHLGSQAEIFTGIFEAGRDGGEAADTDQVKAIRARWDAASPEQQVEWSIRANEGLVRELEALTPELADTFSVALFGADADLDRFVVVKLGEHAVHSWDIAVALDPSASVAADAVAYLLDGLPGLGARTGKPTDEPEVIVVHSTDPERKYRVTTAPEVTLEDVTDAPEGTVPPTDLILPAEAFLRLVYGRLDNGHLPEGITQMPTLTTLQSVFPGL